MSENLPSTDQQNSAVTESEDWSEAPVVQNTGGNTVRDFDAASDDHPLVEYAGSKAQETDMMGGGQFVSEEIYDSPEKFYREWLQNHETACIRRCKMKIELSDEYPDGWLTHTIWVDTETGETVIGVGDNDGQDALNEYEGDVEDLRALEVPRKVSEVVEAAQNLGYDPTITWDIFEDERKMITEDNGIGMTPREFWENFKTPFQGGSKVDSATGGNFGIGSNTVEMVHGPEGAATVTVRSPRPGSEGYKAYSYRGGATAIDGEVPDGFYGTRFEIPVCEDFDISDAQDSIEKFTEKLRVPVLFRQHDAGSTPVEEEYEATEFISDFDETPVVVDRPGEFTVVAGPDVCPRTTYHEPDNPDTFLVSMRIDRNYSNRINTLYDTVVQIHDEQGRIIAGPHRGLYAHRGSVYKTGQNIEKVGELADDDVPLPQPTGDRDRLKNNDANSRFFQYIEEIVTKEELVSVTAVTEQMADADHPADAFRDNLGDWDLFKKIANKHGSLATSYKDNMNEFLSQDLFPDFTDEQVSQIYNLFSEVEVCDGEASYSTKKKHRNTTEYGKLLAEDPDIVYMAASTSGNFVQQFKVVNNTYDDPTIIKIDSASKYEKLEELFGFKKLKEVPLTHPDEDESHDFDVPDSIHEDNINKGTAKTKSKESKMKIRTSADSSAIDIRLSMSDLKDNLSDGRVVHGHQKLVVFPTTGDENISDHYDLAEYAAIMACNKGEYEELAHFDAVVTYDEFTEWSESALIATEDGAMTPEELVNDDRLVILTYRYTPESGDVVKLLSDDREDLRQYYKEDIRDQLDWARHLDGYDGGYRGDDTGNVPDSDKYDTLLAVAGDTVLNRAKYAFDQMFIDDFEMVGLRFTRDKFGHRDPTPWKTLDKDSSTYRLMADTPNWDDDSSIYRKITNRDSLKSQLLLGFHDRGIDPTNYEPEELRDML